MAESLTLCALMLADDCPMDCTRDELYVDEAGDTWDVCKSCHDVEEQLLGERAKMVCAVCGQGGYWVGFQPAYGEYRCANHVFDGGQQ